MSQEKFYVINVFGSKPVDVQIGHIDKKSGQPKAGAVRATEEIGENAIPNFSTAWAKLKRDTKGAITGEIEFLPWGHKEGKLIRIRFLRNCESISEEYQKLKGISPESDEAEIQLKRGKNKFNRATQGPLIFMLEHHGLNRSNGSRNPEKGRVMRFETFESVETVSVMASEIELRQRAERIVLEAQYKTENLQILAGFFGVDESMPDEDIFKQLIQHTQNFVPFFQVMEGISSKFKEQLYNANELELIDLSSEDAVMIVIGGKKDILMTDVEGKTIEEKIEFITDNITEPMYYHALNRLSGELARFKEKVLQ